MGHALQLCVASSLNSVAPSAKPEVFKNPEAQGQCDSLLSPGFADTVYQQIQNGKINMCMGWSLIALDRDQTHACVFIAKHVNCCSMETVAVTSNKEVMF